MPTVQLEQMNTQSFTESGYDTAIIPIGACESHGDHMPFGTDGLTAHALSVKIAENCKRTFVLPPGTFDTWKGWGHAGEAESSIGLALFPQWMHMEHARGQIPTRIDPFVKEVWTFDELTAYGATGAANKATHAKGEKIVEAVVSYMTDYMLRFEAEGLHYHPVDADEYRGD